MKKTDVEKVIEVVNSIKNYTQTLDFNTSTYINKQVIQIMPLLEKELERLENEKININSPKLLVLDAEDVDTEQSLIDYANTRMSELVENNFKIIDFGIYNAPTEKVYIKYTD